MLVNNQMARNLKLNPISNSKIELSQIGKEVKSTSSNIEVFIQVDAINKAYRPIIIKVKDKPAGNKKKCHN